MYGTRFVDTGNSIQLKAHAFQKVYLSLFAKIDGNASVQEIIYHMQCGRPMDAGTLGLWFLERCGHHQSRSESLVPLQTGGIFVTSEVPGLSQF